MDEQTKYELLTLCKDLLFVFRILFAVCVIVFGLGMITFGGIELFKFIFKK